MQQIIELVISVIALLVILVLLFAVYKTKAQKNVLAADLMQAYIDKSILLEKVATLAAEKDANSLKEDDGFIKFLSSSRDWAFEYIENVQTTVQEFKDEISPSIEKLNKTRDANVKVIIQAYNKLVDILPKEETKENK